MPEAFTISADLLKQYQELSFDEDAKMTCNFIPLGSAFWQDEHPEGNLPYKADKVSQRSIFLLLQARRLFWDKHEIPSELEILWLEAKSLIPAWPGFQRMELNDAERQYIDECEEASVEFWEVLFSSADEMEIIDNEDGTMDWSATFSLEEEEQARRPWWKFWKRQ